MQTDHRHRKTALLPSLPLVAIMPGFKIVLIIHSALKSCKKYNFLIFFFCYVDFFFCIDTFLKNYYWTFIPILEHCNRSSNGLRSEAATTSSSSQQQHKYKSRFFPMRTPDLILDDKAVRQWVKTTGSSGTNTTSADSTEMSPRNPRPRSMGEAMAKKPPIHPDRPSRSRSLPNHNLVVRRLSR